MSQEITAKPKETTAKKQSAKTAASKQFIVKRVFIGDKDIKEVIFDIAATKAAKIMGIL